MRYFAGFIIVAAFCAGTIGAAGMAREPEPAAYPLLAIGLAGLVTGGVLRRLTRGAAGGSEEEHAARKEQFLREIEAILARVVELDDAKSDLSAGDLCGRIDSLLSGEYFDLTSRHEDLVALIGFSQYARVWDGVASAERLLSRVWSIATDGHLDEALENLPDARAHLEQAAATMRAVVAGAAAH